MVDLLVLTSLHIHILFNLTKSSTLMRRSTVLSLPPLIVLPVPSVDLLSTVNVFMMSVVVLNVVF
jgi:hypothetical protein